LYFDNVEVDSGQFRANLNIKIVKIVKIFEIFRAAPYGAAL